MGVITDGEKEVNDQMGRVPGSREMEPERAKGPLSGLLEGGEWRITPLLT